MSPISEVHFWHLCEKILNQTTGLANRYHKQLLCYSALGISNQKISSYQDKNYHRTTQSYNTLRQKKQYIIRPFDQKPRAEVFELALEALNLVFTDEGKLLRTLQSLFDELFNLVFRRFTKSFEKKTGSSSLLFHQVLHEARTWITTGRTQWEQ